VMPPHEFSGHESRRGPYQGVGASHCELAMVLHLLRPGESSRRRATLRACLAMLVFSLTCTSIVLRSRTGVLALLGMYESRRLAGPRGEEIHVMHTLVQETRLILRRRGSLRTQGLSDTVSGGSGPS